MAYLTFLLAVVLLFVTAFFAVQNSTVVTVNLFYWSLEASLAVVILGAATLGFAAAAFFGLFVQVGLRYRLYKANRRIGHLEAELLKRPPAKGEEKSAEAPPAGGTGGSGPSA